MKTVSDSTYAQPNESLKQMTFVKRCKLQWYGHVSRSSGLAKNILQGTVKGGRRQGRQRKRWEDNIREWTGLEFAKSSEGSGEQGKMEETGCEIICGAPTTLVVKELMMMMMTFTVSSLGQVKTPSSTTHHRHRRWNKQKDKYDGTGFITANTPSRLMMLCHHRSPS